MTSSAVVTGREHAAFVDRVLDAAGEAAASAGAAARSYRLAGRHVRVTAAGQHLLDQVDQSLAPRRGGDGDPDLHVTLVDTTATGTPPPAPTWEWDQHERHGQIPQFADGDLRVAYDVGWRALKVVDRGRDRAVLWMHDAAAMPSWEVAAPLRTLLHWWLPGAGRRLVHAAAVGTDAGAALLVGPGGQGKSTTALATALDGLRFLGDDYVAVGRDEDQWRVWSLYATAKVDLTRVPDVAARVAGCPRLPSHAEKTTIALGGAGAPLDVVERLPLRVLVLPELVDGTSSVVPARAADVLRALAPSTIMQQPGDEAAVLSYLARLTRDVPSVRLRVGRGTAPPTDLLRDLVEEAARG